MTDSPRDRLLGPLPDDDVGAAARIVTDLFGDDDAWTARARFRAACRRSLYFFTKAVVCASKHPNLLTVESFKESCDWLQFVLTDGKTGLFEDPRNTTKSERSTKAIPPWVAIQRPDPTYDLPAEITRATDFLARYRHIRGPDTRIGIACETREKAAEWVAASMQMWESNGILRWAFPELVWPNFNNVAYGSWEKRGYALPGKSDPTDPNPFVRAMGLVSAVSGSRLDILLIDDLLSEESSESPQEVAYRVRWVDSIQQLLEEPTADDSGASVTLLIENRWCLDDPNSHIHDTKPDWQIWSRAIWECGIHGRGNCGRKASDTTDECPPTDRSIWPERHPNLDGIRRRFGDVVYFTQWGNRPARKAELDAAKLLPFRIDARAVEMSGRVRREACVVVTAVADATGHLLCADLVLPVSQLVEPALTVDPASADQKSIARAAGKTARWAISLFGLDSATGNVYWIDCRADRWTPDVAIDKLMDAWLDACGLFGQRVPIICEKVAAQTLVAAACKFAAQARHIDGPTVHMQPMRIDASVPIRRRLGYRLGDGRLYLREGLTQPRVELRHFPHGTKDTLVTEVLYEEHVLEKIGVIATEDATPYERALAARQRLANAGTTGVW